jgi:TfoX/Sxy family transcriptional regulator of competence genes
MPVPDDMLDLYDRLIATQPDLQRKGATMPYTSINGHMFSFLTSEGHLALRLPSPERDAFLATYSTRLSEQYGKVMKEYVDVPDSLLRNVDELAQHFRTSYSYVSSLKPKPTTRRAKKPSA